MYIEKINYRESTSLFEVTIENKVYSISYKLYEDLLLKKDMEISPEALVIIEDEDIYQKAKRKAENYINYKFRSEREVRTRLYKETSNSTIIDKIIDYYTNLGLINDNRYAKDYVDYCLFTKKYSKAFTKFKLSEKGIDRKLYDPILEDINSDIDFINANHLYEKKYSRTDMSDKKNIDKAYRYLSSKGFAYADIKRVINND